MSDQTPPPPTHTHSHTHTHTHSQFRYSFEDKLHFFIEECDHIQGFHLLVDWDNGFGGLGVCLAQELADEYSTKGLLSFIASPLSQPLEQVCDL